MTSSISFKRGLKIALVIAILFTVSSCADAVPIDECIDEGTYGFWGGLLHGIIAPFSFIASLFMDDVAMYAVNNNGGWYNFGFLFGAAIILGGSGNRARKK